ncbi:MAG: polymer-forming cytoskeletal protein [Caldisericia bacterium]|nr:polymer-forming cytoskeletal protein [Caldisericia bacterium]
MNKKLLIFIFIFLFLVPGTIFAQGIIKSKGDIVIKQNEEIRGDIRVGDGNVTVYGRVLGNIIVLKGNINLKTNSFIKGDVITYNGKINIEEGAVVLGRKIEIIREDEKELNIPALLISGHGVILKFVITLFIFLVSFIFITLFKKFTQESYLFFKSNYIFIFFIGAILFTIFIYNIPKEAIFPFGRFLYILYIFSLIILISLGVPSIVYLFGELFFKIFKIEINDSFIKDLLVSIIGTVIILILIIIPLLGNLFLGILASLSFGLSLLFFIYKIFKSQ